MTARYYVLDGMVARPVGDDVMQWARMFDSRKRHVADDTVCGARISTVFLGANHQWGDGPPLIFETMIFGGQHDGEQWRCSTWEQAEAQHEEARALILAGVVVET